MNTMAILIASMSRMWVQWIAVDCGACWIVSRVLALYGWRARRPADSAADAACRAAAAMAAGPLLVSTVIFHLWRLPSGR